MSNRATYVNPRYTALADALMRPRDWANVISYSVRNDFTGCNQRWAWRYIFGLFPKVTPRALEMGDLVHRGLGAAYRHLDDPDPGRGPREADAELTAWIFQRVQDANVPIEEASETVQVARHYVQRTLAKFWQNDRQTYELVGVELTWRRPLPMPGKVRRSRRDLSRWDATGALDLILRVKAGPEAGQYVLLDWKTWAGTPGRDRYLLGLQTDTQRTAYTWALQLTLDELYADNHIGNADLALANTGRRALVNGMLYSVVRKKVVGEPKTTQCPSCKGEAPKMTACAKCNRTGVGGISKAPCDTLPDRYRALIAQYPHVDPAPVQPIIDALTIKGDTFQFREHLWVDPATFPAWIEETYEAAHQMAASVNRGRWTRNRRECSPLAGSPCAYRGLCEQDSPDVRGVFDRREPAGLKKAYEVAGSDTEADIASDGGDDVTIPF